MVISPSESGHVPFGHGRSLSGKQQSEAESYLKCQEALPSKANRSTSPSPLSPPTPRTGCANCGKLEQQKARCSTISTSLHNPRHLDGVLDFWAAFHFHYQALLNPRHMPHRFSPKPVKSPFLVGPLPRTSFRPATTRIQSLQKTPYRKLLR